MIVKLVLENFMAHGRTELDLAPGLNVLSGPNNTGKSAVVEALRCLTANPAPRCVIRHGANKARVEAYFHDGWRVAWVRRKASAIYEVLAPGQSQPQVYAKMGQGKVPPEVAQVLRLGLVETETGDGVDIHLGDQRRPIFLLDRSGAVLADFLASSTESAHLVAMQNLLRDKVRKAKSDQTRHNQALALARAGLDKLDGLPGLCLAIENLRAQEEDIQDQARAGQALAGLIKDLQALSGPLRGLGRKTGLLAGLVKPPSLAPAQILARDLTALVKTKTQTQVQARLLAKLANLLPPAALAPAQPLARLTQAQAKARQTRDLAQARLSILSGLASPPVLADPRPLARLVQDLIQTRTRLRDQASLIQSLAQAVEQKAKDVSARLGQVGTCPLCGQGLNPECFLSRKAGGHAAQG